MRRRPMRATWHSLSPVTPGMRTAPEARIFFEIRTASWANPWCARRQLRRDRCFVDFGGAFSYRGSSATNRSSCHTWTSWLETDAVLSAFASVSAHLLEGATDSVLTGSTNAGHSGDDEAAERSAQARKSNPSTCGTPSSPSLSRISAGKPLTCVRDDHPVQIKHSEVPRDDCCARRASWQINACGSVAPSPTR
jgi:hypothetical protein